VVAPAAGSAKAGLIRFAVMAAGIAFVLSLTFRPYSNVSAFLLHRQDRWLLLVMAGVTALCCVRLPARRALPVLRRSWVVAIVLAMALAGFAGHFWLLGGYDLSRDEQMASFDAAVFASGHLVGPLPPFWRDHAAALNTLFMYPAEHRGAWISAYLPLNAGLRALFGLVASPWLTGPAMTALGAVALWGCIRRLWPNDDEAACVGLMLYAGSAQVLFAGMTSYAMPGHLALNLYWLWLFLRRTRTADCAALAVGFVATGLHQPLMHPMFVAPFLVLLLAERRWSRAALFGLGYALIGAFWLYWPTWTWSLVQASAHAPRPAGVDYLTRLTTTLRDRDPMGLPDMVANGLRFIAWQHLLLVPLMLVAARQFRRDPMIAALAGGLALTTLTMAVILPYQGHGFGYRYLHGLIGNAILLAIFGWKMCADQLDQWRALLLRTTLAGMLVLLPLQAWMTHAFYAASAQTARQIAAIDADYLVIGRKDVATAADLVLNPPTLDRRPVRLLRDELDDSAITAICASHPAIALVGNAALAPLSDYYGFGPGRADALNPLIAPRLVRAGCRVSRVG
jgi:hypothetical protein